MPHPDVMLDLDADAAASAGPALVLGPARPREMTGKNPMSALPGVTCVAHWNARMNATAVPAFDALFGTKVSTRRKSGHRLLTFPLAPTKTIDRMHRRMTTPMKTPGGVHPKQSLGSVLAHLLGIRKDRFETAECRGVDGTDGALQVAPPGGARACGDWGG